MSARVFQLPDSLLLFVSHQVYLSLSGAVYSLKASVSLDAMGLGEFGALGVLSPLCECAGAKP